MCVRPLCIQTRVFCISFFLSKIQKNRMKHDDVLICTKSRCLQLSFVSSTRYCMVTNDFVCVVCIGWIAAKIHFSHWKTGIHDEITLCIYTYFGYEKEKEKQCWWCYMTQKSRKRLNTLRSPTLKFNVIFRLQAQVNLLISCFDCTNKYSQNRDKWFFAWCCQYWGEFHSQCRSGPIIVHFFVMWGFVMARCI